MIFITNDRAKIASFVFCLLIIFVPSYVSASTSQNTANFSNQFADEFAGRLGAIIAPLINIQPQAQVFAPSKIRSVAVVHKNLVVPPPATQKPYQKAFAQIIQAVPHSIISRMVVAQASLPPKPTVYAVVTNTVPKFTPFIFDPSNYIARLVSETLDCGLNPLSTLCSIAKHVTDLDAVLSVLQQKVNALPIAERAPPPTPYPTPYPQQAPIFVGGGGSVVGGGGASTIIGSSIQLGNTVITGGMINASPSQDFTISSAHTVTITNLVVDGPFRANGFSSNSFAGDVVVGKDLGVFGYASSAQTFGSGLTDCNSGSISKLLWDGTTGTFSCGIDHAGGGGVLGIQVNEGNNDVVSLAASLSFDPGTFNIIASGTTALVKLDYINGPASRSADQTINGFWNFNNNASVSGDFEIAGTASISGATTLSGLRYTWPSSYGSTGAFLTNNASGGLSWTSAVSVQGVTSNSLDFDEFANNMTLDANTSIAFNGNTLNFGSGALYLQGSSGYIGIGNQNPGTKLDLIGGAARFGDEVAIANAINVGSTATVSYSRFGTNATTHALSATSDLLLSGKFEVDGQSFFDSNASVSGNLETFGYASSSQLFGAGLTNCNSAITSKVLWNSATGTFSCGTDQSVAGSGVASNSLDFDELVNAMNLDANTSIASHGFLLTIGGKASISGNFGPGTDDKYVLGSSVKRWKSLSLGPTGSLHVSSTTGTTGAGTDYTDGILEFSTGSSLSLSSQLVGAGLDGSVELKAGNVGAGNIGRVTVGSTGNIELKSNANGSGIMSLNAGSNGSMTAKANHVTFKTGSDFQVANLAGTTTILYVDASGKRVGINVPSGVPGKPLDVEGTSNGAFTGGEVLKVVQLGTDPDIMDLYASNSGGGGPIAKFLQGTTRLNGRTVARLAFPFGTSAETNYQGSIGPTGSADGTVLAFAINSESSGRIDFRVGTGNSESYIGYNRAFVDNDGLIASPSLGFRLTGNAGSNLFSMGVDRADSSKLKIGTTAMNVSTKLTIDSTGNVGIGTSNLETKLEVAGTASVSKVLTGLATSTNGFALCHENNGAQAGGEEIKDCGATPAADYMEMYPTKNDVQEGDIVMPSVTESSITKDGDKVAKLIKADSASSDRLLGIVSMISRAGDFNSVGHNIKKEDNPQPIALNGRVLVTTTTQNGPIRTGDFLTVSSVPGVAMKATTSGRVIGMALESLDSLPNTTTKKIMVFVNPHWEGIGAQAQSNINDFLNTLSGNHDLQAQSAFSQFGKIITNYLNDAFNIVFSKDLLKVANIISDKISAKSIKSENGITTYDTLTGEAYCIQVSGGKMLNTKGECQQKTSK